MITREYCPTINEIADRARRYVRQHGLTSFMNDTKWRELVAAMRSMVGCTAQFRIKDVLAARQAGRWDSEWYHHPHPYVSIEWMDIQAVP